MTKLFNKHKNLLITLSTILIIVIAYNIGIFAQFNQSLIDKLFLPESSSTSKDIIIIAIDENSLNEIGVWPWPRSVHAQLLETLEEYDPKIIGFDVSFFDSTNTDNDFAAAINDTASNGIPVVLASELGFEKDRVEIYMPQSEFIEKANTGYINLISDDGGIVRRIPLVFNTDSKECGLVSFAVQLAHGYYGSMKNEYNSCDEALTVNNEKIPVEDKNYLRINFEGPSKSFTYVSYADVLTGKLPKNIFKDKVILIGSTARNLHDERLTPVDKDFMPGVELQANALNTILQKHFLVPVSDLINSVVIVVLGLSVFIFSRTRKFLILSILLTLLIIIIYLMAVFYLFDRGIILNILMPPITSIIIYLQIFINRYFAKTTDERKIKKAFGQYVSPAVLKEILSNLGNLEVGGKKAHMSVMFSDVRGFTTLSEQIAPDEFISILNSYLTEMSDVIFKNDGVIDKFIGDAIMAFWGAPVGNREHAYYAVLTAIEKIERLKLFNKQIKGRCPELKIGIGINSGYMTVGNMGSMQRFDYTVIGDNVNLASRIEGLTKLYGVSILISEFTFNELFQQDRVFDLMKHQKESLYLHKRFLTKKIDVVKVKGKRRAVGLFEVYTQIPKTEEAFKRELGEISIYQEALEEYISGSWKKASQLFELIESRDPASRVILSRIKLLRGKKPVDWDGSWQMEHK